MYYEAVTKRYGSPAIKRGGKAARAEPEVKSKGPPDRAGMRLVAGLLADPG